MTIAISIKINDGLVLASDSASTVLGQTPDGQLGVVNVYNNASKIFNLRKGLPIGAITWGAGSIGQASISTIVKDLRSAFAGKSPDHQGWQLDRRAYTVEAVAHRLKEFVFDELYGPAFKDFPFQKPDLGFIVAGYSAENSSMADEFRIDIKNGQCSGPTRLRSQKEIGLTAGGDTEALSRLMNGFGSGLPQVLQGLFKVPAEQLPQISNVIQQRMMVPLLLPAMPLQDAIDLGEFLVDLTIKFSRFKPGAPTVGGPVELAAISKAVLSNCCDLEPRAGRVQTHAVVLARLRPIPVDVRSDAERFGSLIANKDPRDRTNPGYIEYFYLEPHDRLLQQDWRVHFNLAVCLPTTDIILLLRKKILQLDDRTRVKFKTKLGFTYMRLSEDEHNAGLENPWQVELQNEQV